MKKQLNDIYWGLVLMAVGAIVLLDNLHIIDINFSWGKFWPVVLILIGASWVIKSFEKK